MKKIIREISNTKDCIVLPPCGAPDCLNKHSMPEDLSAFYKECGGIKFFHSSDYTMEIMPPSEFKLSNLDILGEHWEENIPQGDISENWYVVAGAGPEQKISIDLSGSRLGKCYDSFWDIHATPGESPVVALSFTDLLERILMNKGQYWYWLADGFEPLGDAYSF